MCCRYMDPSCTIERCITVAANVAKVELDRINADVMFYHSWNFAAIGYAINSAHRDARETT